MTEGPSEQLAAAADSGLFDVVADLAQSVVSVICTDDLLEKIPVARIGVVAWNLVGSIRDQLLAKKLYVFLSSLSSVPVDERREMIDRLNRDPKFNQDVGEHLIELLDRVDGTRKPAMLGAVFTAFTSGQIDLMQLRRLEMAIERIPAIEIDNVRGFGNKQVVSPQDEYGETFSALINAGFFDQLNMLGGGAGYKPNDTCRTFLRLDLDRVKPVLSTRVDPCSYPAHGATP